MDLRTINKKLISSFLSLTFRQAVLLAINFITINIILARILPVEVIGIFNIGNTILSFFTFFSDVGLAGALIQKKQVTEEDLKSTFLVQEVLAIIITVLLWISAPFFAEIYKLDEGGIGLIRALAFGFLITSFKVIPSVLLERDLKFTPLVWVDIIEAALYNSILIILSKMHWGLAAFTWATVIRSISGILTIYLIAPWKPKIGFSKNSLKGLLNFGVPFQLNSILALLKDRLVPLVIANIIGPLGVGFVTWSQSLAFLPLLLMNNIIRVTFPAFSRLQEDKTSLAKTLEKSIFLTGLFAYPLIFGLLAIAPSLIDHVVTAKWHPALPLIYLFSINAFWATLSTTFTNVLNAVGKIKITLSLMIMWTALTWILSPLLAYHYGFLGVGFASAIISFTSIIPIFIIRKIIKAEILKNVIEPLGASILMAVITYLIASSFAKDLPSTLITVLIGGFIYILLIILICQKKVLNLFRDFKYAPN